MLSSLLRVFTVAAVTLLFSFGPAGADVQPPSNVVFGGGESPTGSSAVVKLATQSGDISFGLADSASKTFDLDVLLKGLGSPVSQLVSDLLSRNVFATDSCTPAETADIRSYKGILDVTSCLQAAVDRAAALHRRLTVDAGLWHLATGRITIPMGLDVRGEGWGELPTATPNNGTVIQFDYGATRDPYGFYVVGSGVHIHNLELQQKQAAPVTGTSAPGWTPVIGPWAIYAYAAPYANTGGHRLDVGHVMLRNVYDGINLGITRGGHLHDVMGQPFDRGIRIELNVDEPHITDIHFGWPYWSGQADVMAYVHAHLIGLDFQRVDNPYLANIFTFGAHIGLSCTQRTDSYAPGNCNLLTAVNMGHDDVGIGIYTEDGAELTLTNYYCYADPALPGSTCFQNRQNVGTDYYQPLRLNMTGVVMDGAYGPAMIFGWDPAYLPTNVILGNVHVRGYNKGSVAGTPAIAAVRGVYVSRSNLVVDGTTDPAAIFGGYGGTTGSAILNGFGSPGASGWTELTNGMILEWGRNPGNSAVVLPKACPNGLASVTATPELVASVDATETVTVGNLSKTGFTAYSRYIRNNGQYNGVSSPPVRAADTFDWQALCY